MTNRVALLSCVKSKRAQRCRAGDMYISPLFQKMMAYAESLMLTRAPMEPFRSRPNGASPFAP